jgi:hypothetical protein
LSATPLSKIDLRGLSQKSISSLASTTGKIKERRLLRMLEYKEKKETKEFEECSFKPKINPHPAPSKTKPNNVATTSSPTASEKRVEAQTPRSPGVDAAPLPNALDILKSEAKPVVKVTSEPVRVVKKTPEEIAEEEAFLECSFQPNLYKFSGSLHFTLHHRLVSHLAHGCKHKAIDPRADPGSEEGRALRAELEQCEMKIGKLPWVKQAREPLYRGAIRCPRRLKHKEVSEVPYFKGTDVKYRYSLVPGAPGEPPEQGYQVYGAIPSSVKEVYGGVANWTGGKTKFRRNPKTDHTWWSDSLRFSPSESTVTKVPSFTSPLTTHLFR